MPFSGAAERDSFFGGRFDSLKVWAKPMYGAVEGHILERGIGRVWGEAPTGWRCYIVGQGGPLDHGVLMTYVNGLTANGQERLMLEAVAETESEFRHFAQGTPGSTSIDGYPLEAGDHGYGVMQLTDPPPTRVQIWNWQENIDRALTGYVRPCWNAGSNWLNSHPENPGGITDEMRRLETYARYRGGVNPNNVGVMTYHFWDDEIEGATPCWTRRFVGCGYPCSNPRAGQQMTREGIRYGGCFNSIVCHADEALSNEG